VNKLMLVLMLMLFVITGCSTNQKMHVSSFIDKMNGKPSSKYHYSHIWKVFHVDREAKKTYYKCKICTAWKSIEWK